MFPSFAGIIRSGEVSSGKIPHALVCLMAPSILMRKAAWPAFAFDRNSGYSGSLPMGSLLAIPTSVNLTTLGLSAKGHVIATAVQNYGMYVGDRGGSGMTLLSELNNADVVWNNYPQQDNDLYIIQQYLHVISNNGPNSIGGGGQPRVPAPPACTAL